MTVMTQQKRYTRLIKDLLFLENLDLSVEDVGFGVLDGAASRQEDDVVVTTIAKTAKYSDEAEGVDTDFSLTDQLKFRRQKRIAKNLAKKFQRCDSRTHVDIVWEYDGGRKRRGRGSGRGYNVRKRLNESTCAASDEALAISCFKLDELDYTTEECTILISSKAAQALSCITRAAEYEERQANEDWEKLARHHAFSVG